VVLLGIIRIHLYEKISVRLLTQFCSISLSVAKHMHKFGGNLGLLNEYHLFDGGQLLQQFYMTFVMFVDVKKVQKFLKLLWQHVITHNFLNGTRVNFAILVLQLVKSTYFWWVFMAVGKVLSRGHYWNQAYISLLSHAGPFSVKLSVFSNALNWELYPMQKNCWFHLVSLK
jgi:hypothetical protein